MSIMPGTKYLVALDGSDAASWAFHTAVRQMNKHTDYLVLMTVVQLVDMAGFGHSSLLQLSQQEEENKAKALVRRYGKLASTAGVEHFKLNLTYGSDVGEAIVNYITKYPVDVLFIGRRCLSTLHRYVTGSLSKYLIENAPCNVTVVKQPVKPELSLLPEDPHLIELGQQWVSKNHAAEELILHEADE